MKKNLLHGLAGCIICLLVLSALDHKIDLFNVIWSILCGLFIFGMHCFVDRKIKCKRLHNDQGTNEETNV